MKKNIFIILVLFSHVAFSQIDDFKFDSIIRIAKLHYFNQDYQAAAFEFLTVLSDSSISTNSNNYYFAAYACAKLKDIDNSINFFKKCVEISQYSMYDQFIEDTTWSFLNSDKRWQSILNQIKQNQVYREQNFELYQSIIDELVQIEIDDQDPRRQYGEFQQKYGVNSIQMDSIMQLFRVQDSINIVKVTSIIDDYGWLGPNEIGYNGVSAMWLVIQHADLATQEKYYPILKQAYETEKISAGSFAMLEDKINMNRGRKQLYGSQVVFDSELNNYYVYPVEDPDHLDERRDRMDLLPIADYIEVWGIVWNLEEYKKKIPRYMELRGIR
jgi:tetratricopeptide (TPR) repeat protein